MHFLAMDLYCLPYATLMGHLVRFASLVKIILHFSGPHEKALGRSSQTTFRMGLIFEGWDAHNKRQPMCNIRFPRLAGPFFLSQPFSEPALLSFSPCNQHHLIRTFQLLATQCLQPSLPALARCRCILKSQGHRQNRGASTRTESPFPHSEQENE